MVLIQQNPTTRMRQKASKSSTWQLRHVRPTGAYCRAAQAGAEPQMGAYIKTASVTTTSQLAAIAFQGNFKGGKINVSIIIYYLDIKCIEKRKIYLLFFFSEILYAGVGLTHFSHKWNDINQFLKSEAISKLFTGKKRGKENKTKQKKGWVPTITAVS